MNSLAARVGAGAVLVLAVFIVLTAWALERAFADSAGAAMRERLLAQLYLVMAATEVEPDGRLRLPAALGEPRLNLPDSGLYARIDSPDGQPLWQSPSAVGMRLPSPAIQPSQRESFTRVALAGAEYFAATLRIDWQTDHGSLPLIYSVIEHAAFFEEQMTRYRRNLWGWLGAMALLLLVVLAAVLAWGLRPLHTVAAEVRAVESGAQQSLAQEYPREIRRLSDNINTLLHHERAQQARYKQALADLAHSLKTPLAVLRGIDAGAQATLLDEQVTRMDAIVQHQLQRAATAGRPALAAPVAVAPAVQRLLAALAKVHASKAVQVEQAIAGTARFRGEEGDLLELLGNLIDNAFKWCRGNIRIRIGTDEHRLHITVEDDGPGIDDAQVEQVLARGVRLDETIPGHGIGLAMVRDIVAAYEGEMTIGRAALGGAAIHIVVPG
ncbi:MAG: hypothetical protein CVV05_09845 [Gammaproteobacteria bacterium HGW-Gammaproteobacteria-1]|jgi:two-component system sensor histidine kinase PhoQ|nr:MAG: hypothetical protein CVV05_09845 [Gammaproteobacteria bacterium HGW-Gammaproteobacteria-1]